MSSYNDYHNKLNRVAIILPIVCVLTSMYGGLAIFAAIGHMAHSLGTDNVESFLRNGPGLIFVVYPEALSQMVGAPAWTALFFVMVLTVGLDTQFASMETVSSIFAEQFPNTLGKHRSWTTFGACVIFFLLSIIFTTQAGYYFFQVFDWYSITLGIMSIVTCELVALAYFYDARKLLCNIEKMIGRRHKFMRYFWLTSVYGIAPTTVLVIFIFLMLDYSPPLLANGQPMPGWAIAMGWSAACVSLSAIPFFAIIQIYNYWGHLVDLFRPSASWLDAVHTRQMIAQQELKDIDSLSSTSSNSEDKAIDGSLVHEI